MNVEQTLRDFLIEACFQGQPPEGFGDDAELIETGLIDSLIMVDLVSLVESEFGIEFGINDLVPRHFQSISALAGYVRGKLGH